MDDGDNEGRGGILCVFICYPILQMLSVLQWHNPTVPPSGREHLWILLAQWFSDDSFHSVWWTLYHTEVCMFLSLSLSFLFLMADKPAEQASKLSNARFDCKGLQDVQRLHHPAAAAQRAHKP